MRLSLLVVVSMLLGCQPAESPAEASIEKTSAETDVAPPKTLIRLSPDGPKGVGLKSAGAEGEREYIYYSTPTSEWVSAGVWEADPYESGPDIPGYSEFMYIIEGSLRAR